jgi:tetratricopeptide (TPR) repeat protein
VDWKRFERAQTLQFEGRDQDALREFESLVSTASDSREQGLLLLQQANSLWRLDRVLPARQRLSDAEKFGVTPYTELLDARLCIAEGKRENALRKLYILAEKYDGSTGASEDVASLDEATFVDAEEELGRLLVDLTLFAEAIDPLERALDLAEGDQRRRLCLSLGICQMKTQRWQLAIETFSAGLPTDHRDRLWPQVIYYLGVCHFEIGDLEAAERELIQGLPPDRRDPLWPKVQYQLGCVYFQQGAYAKSKKTFEICEFFVHDEQIRKSISEWLGAIQIKLGDGGPSRT